MARKQSIPSNEPRAARRRLADQLVDLRNQLAAIQARCRQLSEAIAPLTAGRPSAGIGVQESHWATLESICDGFFACDGEWRFVYINRLAEKLLGIHREEVIGRNHWEVFPLTLGTKLEREYRKAAAGEVRDFENYYAPWKRWFHNRCFPREGGGMVVYFQDITEHKRQDDELKITNASLQQTLASVYEGYYALDAQWRFAVLNPAAEKHFGKTAAELIGKDIWRETGTPSDSEIRRRFHKAWESGQHLQFEASLPVHPDVWGEMHLYPRDGLLHVHFRDISERKKAEKMIMESEELHRIILGNISDAVFITDESGAFTYICPNTEVIFGYSMDEVKALGNIDNLIGGQLFTPFELDSSGELRNVEHVIHDKSGGTHYLLIHIKRVSIKEGTVLYTCRDITERRTAEVALAESEERYRQLFNNEGDAVMVFDALSKVFEDANTATLDLFGYTKEAFLNLTVEDISHEKQKTRDAVESLVKGDPDGRYIPLRYFKKSDGTIFPGEIFSGTYCSNERKKIIGAVRDITTRMQAEAELRKSEQRFRKIFENAGMGIAITDWNGRFQQCNPAYCKLLGYSEEELRQIEFHGLIHPEDRDANLMLIDRLKSGDLKSFEIKNRFVHKKGHSVWVHKFVSILPNKMGEPAQLMALVSDITRSKKTKSLLNALNRRLLERTKIAEQRANDIRRLALQVSNAEDHERKRLATILHDDFQQTLAYLKIKLANLHAGAGMLTNLATLNNIIDGCIQGCRNLAHELNPQIIEQKGFVGAIRWLCRQMKVMHGLDVTLHATDDMEIGSLELCSMLIRAVRELLFNVVKHSGQRSALVNVRLDGEHVLIRVEDGGKGCDYDRFGQLQVKESAYGLYSIEDRVKFLGGCMKVKSPPGKGFSVTLTVPIDVSKETKKKSIRVLLADDHEVMRDSLAKLLQEKEDIDVVGMAADGREAVELAEKLAPDVVVIDVSMPVMNGIEATKRIKTQLPGTAIIGLTMHDNPEIQEAMLEAGSEVCLTKAESADKLVNMVRSLPGNRK